MYKIYINDRPIVLCSPIEMAQGGAPKADHLVARYSGKPKFLLNYIDLLEKNSPLVQKVTLFSMDKEALWEDFRNHYKIVTAAGGLVHNIANDWLLIYRHGHWDLPKGKIDEGETPEQTAIREVREETGVQDLELQESLGISYHTYRSKKGKRVLKPTHWYAMKTNDIHLTPQAEEGIEQAVWMSSKVFFEENRKIWPNISDLLKKQDFQQ